MVNLNVWKAIVVYHCCVCIFEYLYVHFTTGMNYMYNMQPHFIRGQALKVRRDQLYLFPFFLLLFFR